MGRYKSILTQIADNVGDLNFFFLKDKIIMCLMGLYKDKVCKDGQFESVEEFQKYEELACDAAWKMESSNPNLTQLTPDQRDRMLEEPRMQILILEEQIAKKVTGAETIEVLDGALLEYQKFLEAKVGFDSAELAMELRNFLEHAATENREAVDRLYKEHGDNPNDRGLREFYEKALGSAGSKPRRTEPPKLIEFKPRGRK